MTTVVILSLGVLPDVYYPHATLIRLLTILDDSEVGAPRDILQKKPRLRHAEWPNTIVIT